jgi:acyl carrier protein
MNTEQILSNLSKIINETFCTDYAISESTSAENIDEWDSISHIELISNIEDFFAIRLALGELQDLKNIGDMIRLIAAKIK